MDKLAEQYFEKPDNYKDLNRQRVYLKDIDCPEVWHDKLRENLPPNLFYLNESTGEVGGPGSVDEPVPTGGKRKGRGIAGAGDLMSSLPPPMRAQNMMCYIGHEGTYTPSHREMCSSLGHNIMVDVSEVIGVDGKPERPGSSIWFMTESTDRHSVAEYWLSILGHDIEVEKHFAQVAAWKKAPFTTYIVEQKAGDFILIPPMAPHQVWNRGTRTMKAAWNRTTIETLDMAFKEGLPHARVVCRDEQYKNKAIVFYSLGKYAGLLAKARDQQQTAPSPQEAAALRTSPKIRQLQKDFKRLFNFFKTILLSEMFSPDHPNERNVEYFPFDSNITCAYCRGNIFNRFLTCKTCEDQLGTTEPEPYDVCMDCYAMGRSCGCIGKLRWAEQFKWKELVQKYEHWRRVYMELEGGVQKADSPLTLSEERAKLGKKTLAQINQEQLKRRPWIDVHKDHYENSEGESEEDIEITQDGTVKKKKKKRSEAWLKNHHVCHVCGHRHESWKMAECQCGRKWCYGALFRGFDVMPQQIMEDINWRCPHCQGVCFTGSCRKDPRQNPYEPKGTLLGHDTKRVADVRSKESLVDFSVSNLNWLKETTDAPVTNARLTKRQEAANREKENDVTLNGHYASDGEEADQGAGHREGLEAGISYSPGPLVDNAMIDPSLRGPEAPEPQQLSASGGPNLAALLNQDMQGSTDNLDGYEPAQQSSYVAPSAVMLNAGDAEGDEEEDFSWYPVIEGASNDNNKKRKRASDGNIIKRNPAKKRRPEDRESLPASTKQYRKEQERNALEGARKAGRFIQMHAALRGKSRLVRLKIGRANMSKIASDQAAKEGGAHNDLLKSDIAPPEQPTQRTALNDAKNQKAVRIRVERDEVFDPKHRGRSGPRKPGDIRSATTVTNKRRKANLHYEELEVNSDFSSEDEDVAQVDGAAGHASGGRKQRKSTWQTKRHEGEEDGGLEMLPSDYKDVGRDRTRRPTGQNNNGTSPKSARSAPKCKARSRPSGGAPVAQMTPSSRTQPINVYASGDEDSVLGDGDADESDENITTAAAAIQFQQQGEKARQAKVQAMQQKEAAEYDDYEDEEEIENVKGIASSLAPVARKSPRGKGPQAKAGLTNRGFRAVNGIA